MNGIVDKRYQDHMRAAVYKAERNQARQDVELLQRKVDRLEDHIEKLKVELAAAKSLLRGPSVPRAAYDRQHERLLGHIRECETALGKRNERIKNMGRHIESLKAKLNEVEGSEGWLFTQVWQDEIKNVIDEHIALFTAFREVCDMLGVEIEPGDPEKSAGPCIAAASQECKDELDRRLMPKGMEWPRFEDGDPVLFGDVVSDGDETGRVYYLTFDTVDPVIIGFTDGTPDQDPGTWLEVSVSDGERVKRPAPKVLDADGVEIRVGDELYGPQSGNGPFVVEAISGDGELHLRAAPSDCRFLGAPDAFTHRAPVLAADGKPLSEGEHVWHVETGTELVVKELPKPGEYQAVVVFALPASHLTSFDPDQLTHERPDSWERLEEDALLDADEYSNLYGIEGNDDMNWMKAVRADIVRRAKALAERGQ